MDALLRSIVAGVFGLAFGSFLTVVVDRVPKKESVVRPRSRCPGCGTLIAPRDNIPVVSYLLLRGRCRSCGMRIPARYPVLELATALSFAATAAVWSSPYLIVLLCAFCAVMLAVAAIDLELRIIPNRITYPSFLVFTGAIVLGWAVGQELNLAGAAIGAAAYGGFFFVIALISPGGMGMGDVKLTGVIGLVLGALGLRYVGGRCRRRDPARWPRGTRRAGRRTGPQGCDPVRSVPRCGGDHGGRGGGAACLLVPRIGDLIVRRNSLPQMFD